MRRPTIRRPDLALLVALLAGAWLGIPEGEVPDYAQDWAAGWAVLHGRPAGDPTDALLAEAWDPERAEPYRGTRQPHPPLATVLALPLAALPFEQARGAWCVASALFLVAGWRLAGVPPRSAAASVPLWWLALVLGTHEPLLLLLLAAALATEARRPALGGAALGVAVSLKVYPVLLLPLLVFGRRWRALAAALGVVLAVTVLCEALLGLGTTRAWLAYTGENAARYADSARNLSLVRGLQLVLPGVPPIVLGLGIAAPLLALLSRRAPAGLERGVPVLLLASPLTWRHYVGLASLARPRLGEDVALFVAGAVAYGFGVGWIPAPPRAAVELPLVLVLLSMLLRALRPGPARDPA